MKLPVDSNGVLYDHFCCRFPKKKKRRILSAIFSTNARFFTRLYFHISRKALNGNLFLNKAWHKGCVGGVLRHSCEKRPLAMHDDLQLRFLLGRDAIRALSAAAARHRRSFNKSTVRPKSSPEGHPPLLEQNGTARSTPRSLMWQLLGRRNIDTRLAAVFPQHDFGTTAWLSVSTVSPKVSK
jgi:hypothetical protein